MITGYTYGSKAGSGIGFVRGLDGKIATFTIDQNSILTVTSINRVGAVAGFNSTGPGGNGFVRSPDGSVSSFQDQSCSLGFFVHGLNRAGDTVGSCSEKAKGAVFPLLDLLDMPGERSGNFEFTARIRMLWVSIQLVWLLVLSMMSRPGYHPASSARLDITP